MGTSVGVPGNRAGLGRAASFWTRALLLPLAMACLSLAGGGCQYLSGRSETVGSALYKAEPDIRVRVRKGAEGVQIDGPGRVMVRSALGSTAPLSLATPLTASVSAHGIKLTDASGTAHELGYGNSVEITALSGSGGAGGPGVGFGDAEAESELLELAPPASEPSAAGTRAARKPLATVSAGDLVRLDGAPLPGMVTLRPRTEDGDKFDIIATMPMETYLPGVLDGELYATWPLGTFEMQAVAARTYALHERDVARKQGSAYDVESTTADQVFRGLTKNPVAIDAAKRTRGEVLTWRGQLIKAYYSSTCGGRPGAASDVWPTGTGFEDNAASPLKPGDRTIYCQASPYFKWEVTRGDDDVSARIRGWGAANGNEVKRMGRVLKVEATKANKQQRPTEFKLTDDKGATFKIGAEQMRTACNFPAQSLPAITRETRVPSGDMEVSLWADQVKFSGHGFGHGVGMCQWCAKGMGERGIVYTQALEQFYPGAKVTKAY